MYWHRYNNRAFAMMEYFVLIIILTTALFIFKDYIVRGMSGRWKGVSDQFGYGRQYSPNDTVECEYDMYSNTWYDSTCYENKNCPPGNQKCREDAIGDCNDGDYCRK